MQRKGRNERILEQAAKTELLFGNRFSAVGVCHCDKSFSTFARNLEWLCLLESVVRLHEMQLCNSIF